MKYPTKLYFDMEFTSLKTFNEIISIGIISDSGHELYIEVKDWDMFSTANDSDMNWIMLNVVPHLQYYKMGNNNHPMITEIDVQNKVCKGCIINRELSNVIVDWLNFNFKDHDIQLVGDVCYYDTVNIMKLLNDNQGRIKFNLIPSVIDIDTLIHGVLIDDKLSDKLSLGDGVNSFDVDRAKLIQKINDIGIIKQSYSLGLSGHNALFDSFKIRDCYHTINHFIYETHNTY